MKLLNSVSEYYSEYYRGFTLWLWVVIYLVAYWAREGVFLILAGDLFLGPFCILLAMFVWWSEMETLTNKMDDDESD